MNKLIVALVLCVILAFAAAQTQNPVDPGDVLPDTYTIYIKQVNGVTTSYTVSTGTTILSIKQSFQASTAVPVDRQRLSYNNQFLDDTKTIGFYNILPYSNVFLTFYRQY